jgi:hypothetical protein
LSLVRRLVEPPAPSFELVGQELTILHHISETISCTLGLDEVLRHIVDLDLLEEGTDVLTQRASKDPHPQLIGRIAMKVGEGITGWVAQEAQPVAISRNAPREAIQIRICTANENGPFSRSSVIKSAEPSKTRGCTT